MMINNSGLRIILIITAVALLINNAHALIPKLTVTAGGNVQTVKPENANGATVRLNCTYFGQNTGYGSKIVTGTADSSGNYYITMDLFYVMVGITDKPCFCKVDTIASTWYNTPSPNQVYQHNIVQGSSNPFNINQNFNNLRYITVTQSTQWSGTITTDDLSGNDVALSGVSATQVCAYSTGASSTQSTKTATSSATGAYSITDSFNTAVKYASNTDCYLTYSMTGYTNPGNYDPSAGVLSGVTDKFMNPTLRVNLIDDASGAVSGGRLEVWSSSTRLINEDLTGNTATTLYLPIDASYGTVTVNYVGNDNYLSDSETLTLGSSQQTADLSTVRTQRVTTSWSGAVTYYNYYEATPAPGLSGVSVNQVCTYHDGVNSGVTSTETVTTSASGAYSITDSFIVKQTETGNVNCALQYAKTGYQTPADYTPGNGIITGTADRFMNSLLKVYLIDDDSPTGAVSTGVIEVWNQDGTIMIDSFTLSGNSLFDFYFPVDANTHTEVIVKYAGNNYYESKEVSRTLTLTQQTASLTISETWQTNIVVTRQNDATPLTGFTLSSSDFTCSATSCLVPRTGGALTVSKTGYVTTARVIGANNNGVDVSVAMPATLRVNLVDDLSGAVGSGKIEVWDSSETTKLNEIASLTGNIATSFYFPIDASQGDVVIKYLGTDDYMSVEAISSLSSSSQTTASLTTMRTWRTTINVEKQNDATPLTGFTLSSSDFTCSATSCLIPYNGGSLTVSKSGYVNNITVIPSGNNGAPINVLLNATLHINLVDELSNPVSYGSIEVWDSTELIKIDSLSFTGNTLTDFYLAVPAQDAYVYYTNAGSYANVTTALISLNSDSQAHASLNTFQVWTTPINVYSAHDLTALNPDSLSSTSFYCQDSTCYVPRSGGLVSAQKDGYVTNSTIIPVNNNGNPSSIYLNTTLKVGLLDDCGTPVNNGMIRVNDASDLNTIYEMTFSSPQDYHYLPVSPGTYYIHYIDTIGGYIDAPSTSLTQLSSFSQVTRNIQTYITWPYTINVYNTTGGVLNGFTVTFNNTGASCDSNGACRISRNSYEFNITKDGYIKNSTGFIPELSVRGASSSYSLNSSLRARVTNALGGGVNGVLTAYVNDVEIMKTNIINSNGLMNLPQSINSLNEVFLTFTGAGLVTRTGVLSAGTINHESTTNFELIVGESVTLGISVIDNVTQKAIVNPEIKVTTSGGVVICESSTCNFDTLIHPETVNINVKSPGYFNFTEQGVSIRSGVFTAMLNPTLMMYLIPDNVTVTIIQTMNTESLHDDETYLVTNTTMGNLSLNIPEGMQFNILLQAQDYPEMIIGPYIINYSRGPIIIGSPENRLVLGQQQTFTPGTPIVQLIWTQPTSPYVNDSVTIYAIANGSDSGSYPVTLCSIKVDTNPTVYMDGAYNSTYLTVHKLIGNLSQGIHRAYVACKNDYYGWGNELVKIFTVNERPQPPVCGNGLCESGEELTCPSDCTTSNDTSQPYIPSQRIEQLRMYEELRTKIEILSLMGDYKPDSILKLEEAGNLILNNVSALTLLNQVSNELPLMVINNQDLSSKPVIDKGLFINRILNYENIKFKNEAKILLRSEGVSVTKSVTWFNVNGSVKSLITIKVFSVNEKPDYVVIDMLNPHKIESRASIYYDNKYMTYWTGLKSGFNTFKYVADGMVTEGLETIIFEKPKSTLTESIEDGFESIFMAVTGASISVAGVNFPVYTIIMGAVIGLLVGFFTFKKK